MATTEVEESVMRIGSRIRQIVPEGVALGLTVADGELTFTLMCGRPGAGLLDAMQYVDGGPCVSAVERRRPATPGSARRPAARG
jgi:hypothetical protein